MSLGDSDVILCPWAIPNCLGRLWLPVPFLCPLSVGQTWQVLLALLGSLAFRSTRLSSALLHQSKSCQVNSGPCQEGSSIKNPSYFYITLAGDPPI